MLDQCTYHLEVSSEPRWVERPESTGLSERGMLPPHQLDPQRKTLPDTGLVDRHDV